MLYVVHVKRTRLWLYTFFPGAAIRNLYQCQYFDVVFLSFHIQECIEFKILLKYTYDIDNLMYQIEKINPSIM